jgi:hypothetical protein
MEARAEFRQPRISKGLIAVVAVTITLGLGVMAGTLAKTSTGTSATVNHAIVQGKGGPAVQGVHHRGMQTGEENAVALPSNAVVAPALGDRANDRQTAVTAPAFADRASDRQATVAAPALSESAAGRGVNGHGLIP